MSCLICHAPTAEFAEGQVLGDQNVRYRQCVACGLVFAQEPSWLERSYSEAIARLDVGLLSRCLVVANIASTIIRSERVGDGRFLDWAGGYGTLTRLMRDRGYDFRHTDAMATNIFARGFEAPKDESGFDLVTAIEVLEHLPDPVGSLAPVAARSDRMLVTTEILPEPAPKPKEWWYYTPETGQHITFYTLRSLGALGNRIGMPHVVSGSFVHLFSRTSVSRRTAALVRSPRVSYLAGHAAALWERNRSLTLSDVELARNESADQ